MSPITSNDQFTVAAGPAPTVTGLSQASGTTSGGTVVNISGTNFAAVSQVYFGTVPAYAFFVNSRMSITAISPPEAAGSGHITVATLYQGTSSTSSNDLFTFNTPPVPVVTGLSVHTGTSAGGTSVTITGSGFTEAYSVSVGGTPVPYGDFQVNSDTSISLTTPPDYAGTYDIQVSAYLFSGSVHYLYTIPHVLGS